jgi:hypothetical protein
MLEDRLSPFSCVSFSFFGDIFLLPQTHCFQRIGRGFGFGGRLEDRFEFGRYDKGNALPHITHKFVNSSHLILSDFAKKLYYAVNEDSNLF